MNYWIDKNKIRYDTDYLSYIAHGATRHSTQDYTIIDDIIFIKPHVTDQIERFYYMMDDVTKIVFQESFGEDYRSKFNQVFLPRPNIKHISFGCYFNCPIVLTSCVTHLTFGPQYDQQIILGPSITYIRFGYRFNQVFETSKNLTVIRFGGGFNQPLRLNKRVKILVMGACLEDNLLNGLSKNLKYLCLSDKFLSHIDLPKYLIYLQMGPMYNKPIKLCPNIKFLVIGSNYKHGLIVECAKNELCVCLCCDTYPITDNLPNNIEHVIFGWSCNAKLMINNFPNNTSFHSTKNYSHYKTNSLVKKLCCDVNNFLYLC